MAGRVGGARLKPGGLTCPRVLRTSPEGSIKPVTRWRDCVENIAKWMQDRLRALPARTLTLLVVGMNGDMGLALESGVASPIEGSAVGAV